MDCLQPNFIRKFIGDQNYVIPSKLLARRQRIASRCNASFFSSSSYGRRAKFTCKVQPLSSGTGRYKAWRALAVNISLEDEASSLSEEQPDDSREVIYTDASGNVVSHRMTSDELNVLLADSERNKLLRKLSEANQYNRFLKRQLQTKDDMLDKFKTELAVLELELQSLVGLAEEITNYGAPSGSRQINGKYIHSHLLSRLAVVHDKICEHIKDVDLVSPQEVTVFWVGMAESVQIMGSFDGWTQGEEMSPEYSGSFAQFSATLKLRPGKYEIKFLVDGEWQLSPEYPSVGEGMVKNNLLIVE